jgi:hypothetical protein
MLISYMAYKVLRNASLVTMHTLALDIQSCYHVHDENCQFRMNDIKLCAEHAGQLTAILGG